MYPSLLHYFRVIKQSKEPLTRESVTLDEASLIAGNEFNRRFKAASYGKVKQNHCVNSDRLHVRSSEFEEHCDNAEVQVRNQQADPKGDWAQIGQFCISPTLQWQSLLDEWNDDGMLKFYCNALQCRLPDPINLKRWRLVEEAACPQCRTPSCTSQHILASCRVALEQGRYSYRHDKVLAVVREAISLSLAVARKTKDVSRYSTKLVQTEKSVAASELNQVPAFAWLNRASDWKILMDSSPTHYIFPSDILKTHFRPDLLVFSKSLRKILIVELTVPWENNIPDQHLHKEIKYAELVVRLGKAGFDTRLFVVEVGARGLIAKSLWHFLKWLELPKKAEYSYLTRISKAAIESSYVIWLCRDQGWNENIRR